MRIILVIAFVLCCFGSIAQKSTITSWELWSGASLDLKMNKKWGLDIMQQFRFKDTLQSNKTLSQIGLKRKLSKRMSLKLSYRHTWNPADINDKRFMLDFNYKNKKKKKLQLGTRLRFQNSMKTFDGKHKTFIRLKIKSGYNLTKLVDPFVSGEAFFKAIRSNEFRSLRATGGLDWRLNKQWHLKSFVRIDREVNVKNPTHTPIVGLMLNYSPNLKKKK